MRWKLDVASDSSQEEEPDEDEPPDVKGEDSGELTIKSRSCCSSFKRTAGVGDCLPRADAPLSESHGRKIFSLCVLHGISVILSW